MSGAGLSLPKLYAIIDVNSFGDAGEDLTSKIHDFAKALMDAGATILQFRSKKSSAREVLSQARELSRIAKPNVKLIMNDRADLALAARFDGVHLGQGDLSAHGARCVLGTAALVGISTHDLQQVREAATLALDYIAVGPVFATSSKLNPEPAAGLELVRAARKMTTKPLVAIGGITRDNCRSVLDAGADSVAVISDLLDSPQKRVEEFFRLLG